VSLYPPGAACCSAPREGAVPQEAVGAVPDHPAGTGLLHSASAAAVAVVGGVARVVSSAAAGGASRRTTGKTAQLHTSIIMREDGSRKKSCTRRCIEAEAHAYREEGRGGGGR